MDFDGLSKEEALQKVSKSIAENADSILAASPAKPGGFNESPILNQVYGDHSMQEGPPEIQKTVINRGRAPNKVGADAPLRIHRSASPIEDSNISDGTLSDGYEPLAQIAHLSPAEQIE